MSEIETCHYFYKTALPGYLILHKKDRFLIEKWFENSKRAKVLGSMAALCIASIVTSEVME